MVRFEKFKKLTNEEEGLKSQLKIGNQLRVHREGINFGSLITSTGLSRAVVHKHLKTFKEAKKPWVVQDSEKRYHLTPDGEKELVLLEERANLRQLFLQPPENFKKLFPGGRGLPTAMFMGDFSENEMAMLVNAISMLKKDGTEISGNIVFYKSPKEKKS